MLPQSMQDGESALTLKATFWPAPSDATTADGPLCPLLWPLPFPLPLLDASGVTGTGV